MPKVTDKYIEECIGHCKKAMGKQMTDHGNGVIAETYYVFKELKERRTGTFDQSKAPIFPECFFTNNLKIHDSKSKGDSLKLRHVYLELVRLRKAQNV